MDYHGRCAARSGRTRVTTYLLDINVLIPLLWPRHTEQAKVRKWFRANAVESFSTCSLSQAGFLRITSSPGDMKQKFSILAARELLFALSKEPGHRFWPTTIDVFNATNRFLSRMQGPKQVTDAYLLSIAIHHQGKLATMDRAILHLAGPEFAAHVELIE